METEPRYSVYDSLRSTASSLITPARRRTRYWIIDNTNGHCVDELCSKRAATLTARDMNQEADAA